MQEQRLEGVFENAKEYQSTTQKGGDNRRIEKNVEPHDHLALDANDYSHPSKLPSIRGYNHGAYVCSCKSRSGGCTKSGTKCEGGVGPVEGTNQG
jgi:hypothetical protein